mmetsp:Transcript_7014/g.12862  ORF Transcript_7014/g.12862 Transcript_7014/m.12862 type:complete len:96 (-) Transcript_7014:384-671(-)
MKPIATTKAPATPVAASVKVASATTIDPSKQNQATSTPTAASIAASSITPETKSTPVSIEHAMDVVVEQLRSSNIKDDKDLRSEMEKPYDIVDMS